MSVPQQKQEQQSKKEKKHPLYRRYYLPEDLESHSGIEDCWLSLHGRVLDLSSLLIARKGDPLCKPIAQHAGRDVSHWFDPNTIHPRQRVDAERGVKVYYLPQGRFLHVPSDLPGEFDSSFSEPWWKDKQYEIGKLTAKPRKIRIINTLTHHEEIMEVPAEETLDEIQTRYLAINSHSTSYTWKDCNGRILDLHKTLAENGIADEDEEYDYLDVPDAERHLPSILIYFNDDLTEA